MTGTGRWILLVIACGLFLLADDTKDEKQSNYDYAEWRLNQGEKTLFVGTDTYNGRVDQLSTTHRLSKWEPFTVNGLHRESCS